MYKLALLALLVGCSKSDSGDILTHGMYASITARAEGNGSTRVVTELMLGNPIDLNFIELSDGDQLLVRHSGQQVTPTESDLLNIVSYTATFQTEAEGESFEVAFLRTVDSGAPSSTMTLPAPFSLGAIPATSSRNAALNVTWSPSGSADSVHVSIDGTCIDTLAVPVTGDPGSASIPAGMIHKRMAQPGNTVPDMCEATLHVERTREGSLDSHYGKGGSATGVQARTATFMTAP